MQVLAWNGGGKSNYSSIISEGGYKLNRADNKVEVSLPSMEDVEEEFEVIGEKAKAGSKKVQAKLEKLTEKFEDFVADEMEEFFADFKQRMSKAHME